MLVKDAAFIQKLRPLVEKIKTPYEIDQYMEYMRDVISGDDVILLVDVDEKNVRSFILAEVLSNVGYKTLFIDLAFFSPKDKSVSKEFDLFLERFAKMKGCDRLALMCDVKRSKAFAKKYSFEAKSIYLERKINKTEVLHEQHI